MNWIEDVENTPSSVRCWYLCDEIITKIDFGDTVPVYLVAETKDRQKDLILYRFDFQFIQSILSNLDNYCLKAIDYIENKLKEEPLKFGLSKSEVNKKLNTKSQNSLVSFPSVTFYEDSSWIIRFADGDFPIINYGFGLIVYFNGQNVTEMEIITDDPIIIE